MNIIAISASIRHKELIRRVIEKLKEIGVTAMFPNIDSSLENVKDKIKYTKQLEADHFHAIDKCECLYVICPEGIIGVSVSIEIGYAVAKGKPIVFSETPNDLGLQALKNRIVALEDIIDLKVLE